MKIELDTLVALYAKFMRNYLSDKHNKNISFIDSFDRGYNAGAFRTYQDWLYNEVGRTTFDIIEEKLCKDFAIELGLSEHEIMNTIT